MECSIVNDAVTVVIYVGNMMAMFIVYVFFRTLLHSGGLPFHVMSLHVRGLLPPWWVAFVVESRYPWRTDKFTFIRYEFLPEFAFCVLIMILIDGNPKCWCFLMFCTSPLFMSDSSFNWYDCDWTDYSYCLSSSFRSKEGNLLGLIITESMYLPVCFVWL